VRDPYATPGPVGPYDRILIGATMGVPKRKLSKRRSRMRASHHALTPRNLGECPRCKYMREPHRVCPNCGYYRDREVIAKEEE
jgi:large subunit ribosomal protein L32